MNKADQRTKRPLCSIWERTFELKMQEMPRFMPRRKDDNMYVETIMVMR